MSKRVSDAALIRALRCISTAGGASDCSECPYRAVELTDTGEYEGCDVDKAGLDAADRLEELSQGQRPTYQLTGEQWEVLRTYADCKMRLSTTAERMFVHENTVRYRLRGIRQQTGLDPRTFGGLAELLAGAGDHGED